MNQQTTQYSLQASLRTFFYKVYGWMAVGLALTAGTAFYVSSNVQLFQYLFKNSLTPWLLIGAQLALVIALAGFINRMNMAVAGTVFALYSVLNGVTLSSIFFVYSLKAIFLSFGITSAMFVVMALYGYLTDTDLSGVGSYAQMALWGIIIAMVVNIFMRSSGLDYIVSLIGVGIFTILIAYDSQKLKQIGASFYDNGDIADKAALLGALTLYLDFINLFLFLLRIFGGNRRSE